MEPVLLTTLLSNAHIPKRLCKKLKVPTAPINWGQTELLAIPTTTSATGVLLVHLDGLFYATPYTLTKRRAIGDGKLKPIICDFCLTWLAGNNAALITFASGKTVTHTFYCCAALGCPLHVRGATQIAAISRAQIRENVTTEKRITRLQTKLSSLVTLLELAAIEVNVAASPSEFGPNPRQP